ncbi:MAG TPA: ABC transporter permease, partial [Promineifilum sp.]
MNTLQLKTFRDLWLYKSRTILVVLAIAIGTAAVGVATTSFIVMRRDLRDGYHGTNPAHAVLDVTTASESLAGRVAALPGVAEATARRQTSARLLQDDGETRALLLWTLPDFDSPVGKLYRQPGAVVPPPDGSILLERSIVPILGVARGDVMAIRTIGGETEDLTIAGFVNDLAVAPTTVQPVAYGYISDETAAQLGIQGDYNQLAITVSTPAPDRAAVESVVTAVTAWLEDEGVIVTRAVIPEPGVHLMQGSVDTGLLMIGILGGLTMLLSAFLVTNIMSAVIAQQVPIIGVLKALGGDRGLIFRQYGRMVLLFGTLALILAVPIGLLGAWFQSSYLAGQLNYDIPSFGLPWQTLLIQLAGALLVPALAALGPVRGAANVTIREALGGQGIGALTRGGLLTRLEGLPRLFALALRNIARRKVRLLLTLLALSLAGAMFMATFGLRSGLIEA